MATLKGFFIFNIMKEMEIWKPIKDYEGLYEVSNLGSVRSLDRIILTKNKQIQVYKSKVLKPDLVKGYQRITLSKDNKTKRILVHRLVALIFIPNYKNKPCVNHINGVKTDNTIKNLEWCTYSENERHSYDCLKKINNNRIFSNSEVSDIRKNAIKGFNKNKRGNVKFFMDKYKSDRSTILRVLNKKTYA